MENPRNDHTQALYTAFKQAHQNDASRLSTFDFTEETILRTFTHWFIIKNRFPYDRMAKVNDMLVSKRPIETHYNGTKDEQAEYHTILQTLAKEGYYDAIIENFPKVKSVTQFAHTHLVIWHGA